MSKSIIHENSSEPIEAIEIDPLSDEFYQMMHSKLQERVGKKRLRHIEGVAETASQIAMAYGADCAKAKLSGLLHDWDKGMDNEQIRRRAVELGIADEMDEWVLCNMPEVVHGISAAKALSMQYPHIPEDVIHAIKVHTTACEDMTDLDKILYIADAIEPGRDFDELSDLRSMIGNVGLDDLYFEVYKFWLNTLIMRGRALYPDTVKIWNGICENRKAGEKKRTKC